MAGGPPLYEGTLSEYPPAANLLFAAVRLVADCLHPAGDSLRSFAVTWMALAWWAWLAVAWAIGRSAGRAALLLWLTPTSVYFSVLHFDVVTVGLTLAALTAARGGRPVRAAAWLGLAIAVKGYALFAVPALAVWALRNAGIRSGLVAGAVAIAPLAFSMLGTLVLLDGDLAAALWPFRWQAMRPPNGESTWDALDVLARGLGGGLVAGVPGLPFALAITGSALAALLRPRTFEELCRSFTVAIGGFMMASVFSSGQFALWLVPSLALSGSTTLVLAGAAFEWGAFLYAPVSTHLPDALVAVQKGALVAITAARLALIGLAGAVRRRPPGTVEEA